ncbi:hypothetical protein, partial [Winogradskya humida]|uniref:hypothetical protein n=1 Tax=Winogradskya humida TaxID=113566 RepID=UPI0019451713
RVTHPGQFNGRKNLQLSVFHSLIILRDFHNRKDGRAIVGLRGITQIRMADSEYSDSYKVVAIDLGRRSSCSPRHEFVGRLVVIGRSGHR